jgi:hypothetical protein
MEIRETMDGEFNPETLANSMGDVGTPEQCSKPPDK